jgi:hypothetical protein
MIAHRRFVKLPESGRSRWGEALDANKMEKCVRVRPELVAQTEFLEWTDADRLGIQSLWDCERIRIRGRL